MEGTSVNNYNKDESYFQWLESLVHYDPVLDWAIHNHYFYSPIRMDENRNSDGLYMRQTYFDSHGVKPSDDSPNASVFEALIALASRCEETCGYVHDISEWYAMFIENMGLSYFIGKDIDEYDEAIGNHIRVTLNHDYDYNGEHGGLFPMKKPPCDLRTIELWWQMQYWITENHISE